MNNGKRIVCKVIDEGVVQPLLDRGIDHTWFNGTEQDAVKMILNFYEKYGTVPQPATFKAHMGSTYGLVHVPEAWDYLLDALTDTNRWIESQRIVPDVSDLLKAGDTEGAVARLADGLSRIERFSVKPVSLVDSMHPTRLKERWEDYERRESSPGLLGLSTGFPTIDAATLGLQPGHLVTVLAQPKVGKTSVCLAMANHIYSNHQLPVMFVSFEMGHTELEMRQESLMAGVSFKDLQSGKLDPSSRDRYVDFLSRAAKNHTWPFHIMDASAGSTVSAMRAQIEKHDPGVVFLDGIYMMSDEISGEVNTSTSLTNITRSLKKLAVQTKRPIVINTQALGWKSKGHKISLDSAGYSSSFAQDSDVILGLERFKHSKDDDDEDFAYQRLLKILASRNSGLATVELIFDYDEGSIEECTP